jgi:hypothetical protein
MASDQIPKRKHDNGQPGTTATRTAIPKSIRPTEDEIRMRAYHLWQARGRDHGQDRSDWYEAERQLMREKLTH